MLDHLPLPRGHFHCLVPGRIPAVVASSGRMLRWLEILFASPMSSNCLTTRWWRLVVRLLFDAIGQFINWSCHGLATAPLRGQVDCLEACFRSSLSVLSR